LLLFDIRCLGAAPGAFEIQHGAISLVLKSGKQVADEQFSFEKWAAQWPTLLKASQWQSDRF
jgi:hypothetical protein